MITKINPINNNNNINFRSNLTNIALLRGEGYRKALSLTYGLKDVLKKVKYNESLIDKIKTAMKDIKLSKTALVYNVSPKDSVRIYMPRGEDGNLFTMQLLEDKKPTGTVTIDYNYGRLVSSYSLNNEIYVDINDYDRPKVFKIIDTVYDEIRQKLSETNEFINQSQKPIKKPDNASKLIITTTTQTPEVLKGKEWKDFSLTEIMRQKSTSDFTPKITIPKNKYDARKLRDSRININTTKTSAKAEAQDVSSPSISSREKQVSPIESKKMEQKDLGVGIINDELKSKIQEITNLYNEIKALLKTKSKATIYRITSAYPDLIKNNIKHLEFKDFKISFTDNKRVQEKIISITNPQKAESYSITNSGKFFEGKEDIKTLVNGTRIIRFLTPDNITERIEDENFKNLLKKTLLGLKNFKLHIENQGWRTYKEKQINNKLAGILDIRLQEKLKNITERFKNNQEILNSIHNAKATSIRKDYNKIITIRGGRNEFVNFENDGYSLSYNYLKNRFGEFHKIAKHKGDEDIQDLFLISTDGKLIKNLSKAQLKNTFIKGKKETTIYYSEDELKNLDLTNLERFIDILDKNFIDYEKYILESRDKYLAEKPTKKTTGNIDINTVKEFLHKTVSEIQASADKLREITGYKSTLDSVAENLKAKFEEFLKQFKA